MLETLDLCKRFSGIPAVEGVSFRVSAGEILGYLGPNGSGKSTTVKMITGLLQPSSGEIRYRGELVHPGTADFKRYQRHIGYVPEEPYLYLQLSAAEYLFLIGRLRKMRDVLLREKIAEGLRQFGLWEDRYSPMASYSKGMRQKVLLLAAILDDPDLIILDEPFSGLDISTALMMRLFIKKLAEAGKAVFFSSHVIEVVEKVCASVIVLRRGKVVGAGTIDSLRTILNRNTLEEVFTDLVELRDSETAASNLLALMRG
ncbi:MAG: ABC transporter ATP-binding protein [Bryobacterales bacterium]|nr:ABC transporter ATP-binding protein [Bryobacterales bacterium]